jgi:hypothetical protein
LSTEGATAWRQERRLEQEQKAKQLQDALESASTPEDRSAAAQAIYGPSVFKQHAENLFGRLIGRTPQPIVNPAATPSVITTTGGIPLDQGFGDTSGGQLAPTKAAPSIGDDSQLPALPSAGPAFPSQSVTVKGPAPQNRANALAGVLARGTTREQRQLALERGILAAGNEAQIAGLTGKEEAFQKLAAGKTPAEQMRLARLFGMQPQQTMREYTLPDGTRQWMYPYEADAQGLTATMGGGVPKVSDFTDSKGNIYHGTEQDGVFKNAAGQVIPDAKPYVKPSNRNVPIGIQYAQLYSKKLLADKKQGPPLTNEEAAQLQAAASSMTLAGIARANAMAKAQAFYGLVQTQDASTGADVWAPRMDVLDAARRGEGPLASRNSQRAMLAASALQQIDTMKDLLDSYPGLVGPIAGRANAIAQMGGIQSPEFARLRAAALYLAEHGSGVFGSRSIKTVEDLEKTITDPAFNVDAFKAALDQSEETNRMFLNPLNAPAPKMPGAKNPPKPATPPPATADRKWSKSAWKKANPSGDLNAATAAAIASGRTVVE